jgi:hypothetical protein
LPAISKRETYAGSSGCLVIASYTVPHGRALFLIPNIARKSDHRRDGRRINSEKENGVAKIVPSNPAMSARRVTALVVTEEKGGGDGGILDGVTVTVGGGVLPPPPPDGGVTTGHKLGLVAQVSAGGGYVQVPTAP